MYKLIDSFMIENMCSIHSKGMHEYYINRWLFKTNYNSNWVDVLTANKSGGTAYVEGLKITFAPLTHDEDIVKYEIWEKIDE